MYINNIKFAKEGKQLNGVVDLATISRLQQGSETLSGEVTFELSGGSDKLNRPTLYLFIYGIIGTLCQNCLQPMEVKLENRSALTIFKTEDQLDQALFNDSESEVTDGVLAEAEFDVMQLVEDEIIMSLPYASKHDSCVGLSYHDDSSNSFSVLKQII